MITGTILSHTRMGERGLCTSIAAVQDGTLRQLRPRMPGNMPTHFGSFGLTEEVMLNLWTPGRMVTFAGVTPVLKTERRASHPEDVYLEGPVRLLATCLGADELQTLVRPFIFKRLEDLYPSIVVNGQLKACVPQPPMRYPLLRSVGYIRGRVTIGRNESCTVRDVFSVRVECKIKDEAMLARIRAGDVATGTEFPQALVRFSIGDPLERRCHLMVSHIIP